MSKSSDIKAKRQAVIDRAERFKHLESDPAFIDLKSILKQKQKDFNDVWLKPKKVGTVDKVTIDEGKTKRIELVKYTKEDDTERLKEAQIRVDTLNMVMTIVESHVKFAEYLKKVIEAEEKVLKEQEVK